MQQDRVLIAIVPTEILSRRHGKHEVRVMPLRSTLTTTCQIVRVVVISARHRTEQQRSLGVVRTNQLERKRTTWIQCLIVGRCAAALVVATMRPRIVARSLPFIRHVYLTLVTLQISQVSPAACNLQDCMVHPSTFQPRCPRLSDRDHRVEDYRPNHWDKLAHTPALHRE